MLTKSMQDWISIDEHDMNGNFLDECDLMGRRRSIAMWHSLVLFACKEVMNDVFHLFLAVRRNKRGVGAIESSEHGCCGGIPKVSMKLVVLGFSKDKLVPWEDIEELTAFED